MKRRGTWFVASFIFVVFLIPYLLFLNFRLFNTNNGKSNTINSTDNTMITPSPVVDITPSPTPTPKPLTFAQMNALYGPCTNTPVLMYHHIQSKDEAIKNNQISLSTYTGTFEEQLKYLQSKGYQTIKPVDLITFFNRGLTIPVKSVILTFDDGYRDFYTNAFPLLQKYGFGAIVFVPTGLINNSGYLTWDEISEMNKTGIVYFGNHTWSHYATIKDDEKITTEIGTADSQLSEKGLNQSKVFAYPYGTGAAFSQNYLKSINYNLAFTTSYGKILCAKRNLTLPRVRMGNLMPDYYGL